MKKKEKNATDKPFINEEICAHCEEVTHNIFHTTAFWKYKEGAILCPCGEVSMPCNACGGKDADGNEVNCNECPWRNTKPKKPLTDLQYLKWVKKNEPEVFKAYKEGVSGEYYKEIIEKKGL